MGEGSVEALTDVNILDPLLSQTLPHLLRKLHPHVLPAPVHGDAVDVAVGPREVDVLEDVGGVRAGLDDLAELGVAALLDEDGLAGEDVHDVGEAELAQGDGLRGHEVVCGALEGGGGAGAEAEGTDGVGVPGGCGVSELPLMVRVNSETHLKPRMPKPATMAVQAKAPWHFE